MRANLIDADPMVTAVFDAVRECDGSTEEKLMAVMRAGKIAEAYFSGARCGDSKAASKALQKASSAPSPAGQ